MTTKLRPALAAAMTCAAMLSACALPQERVIGGTCGLDDPASKWVLRNNLTGRAMAICPKGYERIEETVADTGSRTEITWRIRCTGG
ncbi:MAG: hypothetical protein COW30_14010 [Rhodospirillales bacterium CG15_BIG_FIL_POST_REV_8_21_14_020_66_15]|nr:MAG: hypothetical protein COW30_14010 [Rhodospirillales bacterium CG15_BIG_FIL_POST_REV_8_21_14_020_66_15]